jgi:acyl-[acyl-carrier-protein]-phospholipid O-acyltransferase/long-chain-fatty-acid--[acyl-carrier-protein] ligase
MTAGSYRETLTRKGLPSFLWTQFLGAFNDNLFKIVVSLMAVRLVADGRGRPCAGDRQRGFHSSLPAVLRIRRPVRRHLQQADRFNRHQVARNRRDRLGLIAFVTNWLELTYVVLFLIALQATFFSPAKYGILPEILPDRDLSRANGVLEMSTFVAIVLGTAIGGCCSTSGMTACGSSASSSS